MISGNYLTFYTTTANCSALQPVINHFQLKSSFADSPEHQFLHHPVVDFSRQGDRYPHKHLKFHKDDRSQALKEILEQTKGYAYFLQEWELNAWNIASGTSINESNAKEATLLALAALDARRIKLALPENS